MADGGTSRRGVIAAAAALATGVAAAARAQGDYPTRPVRLVVAWAPGGSIDTLARRLSQFLSLQTGQSFVVENRSGATGTIGAAEVARAAPDGYTLLALDSTYGLMPFTFSRLPFDHASLVPITITGFNPVMLAVHRDSPFRSVDDVVDAAKRAPDRITYGSGGVGSAVHFATAAFELAAGVKLYHVPYRGGGEAVQAVMSKQVDLVFSSPGSAATGAGALLRPLAITGQARVKSMPEVPTFAEAGWPGYGVVHWSGLGCPRGTPVAVMERLYQETVKALQTAEMQAFLESIAATPGGMSPPEVAKLLATETERWREVVQAAGIRAQ